MASNSYGMWFLELFGGVGWADFLGTWIRGCVGSWIYWYFDCVSFDWLVYCLKQLLVECLWCFTAIKISTFKYLSIMLAIDGHKCHARWMDGGWFLGWCYVSFRECKKDSSCRVRYNSATSTDFPGKFSLQCTTHYHLDPFGTIWGYIAWFHKRRWFIKPVIWPSLSDGVDTVLNHLFSKPNMFLHTVCIFNINIM